jgi:hypothetical protein
MENNYVHLQEMNPVTFSASLSKWSEHMSEPHVYLSPTAAAALIGLRSSTLAAWRCCRSDGPPFVKLGASVRYQRSALLDWVAARTRVSTAPRSPKN